MKSRAPGILFEMSDLPEMFDLRGAVVVITGGAGLLGRQHAEAIAKANGVPVLLDRYGDAAESAAMDLEKKLGSPAMGVGADITRRESIQAACDAVLARFQRVDVLINNAANNPKVESGGNVEFSRFENFPIAQWEADIAVGVTGAFLCSQIFGPMMAAAGKGVIINVASDLGVIAPDQRIYRKPGLPEDQQPVKPVTYSVVKTALIGLTRYLATYWADRGVRANSISPGGVFNGQPDEFVEKLTSLIPMRRMARLDEYQGAIVFLCSDAASYMNGANLVIDGGRTAW